MTNIKRGLSQVARDGKHMDETKAKKNKSQSVQKVAAGGTPKSRDSHESRSKKMSQQKRKKSERSSTGSHFVIAIKKDVEQHKNKTNGTTSKVAKPNPPAQEPKKKKNSQDIVLKTSVRSVISRRKEAKTGKPTYVKVKTKEDGTKHTEKLSKEKLDQYVSYIAAKLAKSKPPEGIIKPRHEGCFKSPDVFGTINYRTKEHIERISSVTTVSGKSTPPKNSSGNRPRTLAVDSSNPTSKRVTTPKRISSPKSLVAKPKSNKNLPLKFPPRIGKLPVTTTKPVITNAVPSITEVRKDITERPPVPQGPKIEAPEVKKKSSPSNRKSEAKYSGSIHPKAELQVSSHIKYKPDVKRSHTSAKLIRESSHSKSLQEKTSSSYKRMKHQTAEDLLKFYKDRVEKAIKDKKTFTVCGNFWSVRKALLERGWIEKIHYTYSQLDREHVKKLMNQSLNELIEGVSDRNHGTLYKRVIMSKMLGRHQVDLFWDFGCDPYKVNPDNVKLTIINNIRRGMCSYSTKEGLCEIMKRSHWYHFPGLANINHPRSYTLTDNGDPDEFISDFRTTACMSMLKWIVGTVENNQGKIISESGKVPIKSFHFALNECDKFLQKIKHEDIDIPIRQMPQLEWNNFLENYYRCVHIGNHFRNNDIESEQTVVHKSKIMLNKLRKIYPSLDMDGYMNIWILKPTAGSRGIGIHICRTLSYVLRVVSERKTTKYVIQKYIERPLLIYNTKFDIRQWFLISSTNPLTIWMYKTCYLRFSSQTYNLRKLHESIHLTNNSVQCKYKNMNRDPALPEYNMWDSNRFRNYLETIGFPHVYDSIIYPGMKQSVTAAVLIQQEYINTRKNCFELYGADFMLTEDFQPWLIEINSRPALYASTPITGRMCPQVLEDVIKVIVDHARNPKANTGNFELAYLEKQQNLPPVDVSTLAIRGLPLSPEYFLTPSTSATTGAAGNKPLVKIPSIDFIDINNPQHYMLYASKQLKQTLRTLLDVIGKERQRRKKTRSRTASTTTRGKSVIGSTNTIMKKEASNCMPYVVTITEMNKNLKEIQEIFVAKHITDKNLKDLTDSLRTNGLPPVATTASSNSSIVHNVVYTEIGDDLPKNTVDKSEMTYNKQKNINNKCKFSKEDRNAIQAHRLKIQNSISKLSKHSLASSGFLGELHNYLSFWRGLSTQVQITSAPVSSKVSSGKMLKDTATQKNK